MSDRVATIAISAVALVCCLGLPLVLAAGAGGLVWIVGAGAPLVTLAALGAWVFARRGGPVRPAVDPQEPPAGRHQ